jgi:hypothetical protein
MYAVQSKNISEIILFIRDRFDTDWVVESTQQFLYSSYNYGSCIIESAKLIYQTGLIEDTRLVRESLLFVLFSCSMIIVFLIGFSTHPDVSVVIEDDPFTGSFSSVVRGVMKSSISDANKIALIDHYIHTVDNGHLRRNKYRECRYTR